MQLLRHYKAALMKKDLIKYQNVRSYDYLMAKFYTGYQPDKTEQVIR